MVDEVAGAMGAGARLWHTPSSYYSGIARLALAEGGVRYEPVFVDIHLRMQQQRPEYVRLNPNMTVPTLVLPDRVLDQSRAIAAYALGVDERTLDPEAKQWVDRHYAFPIEELTFGGILAHHRMARIMVPKVLGRARRRLLACADRYPELADLYRARAEVFGERIRTFDPGAAVRLWERRRGEAVEIAEGMERRLADGRAVLVPPGYGMADTVLTVFLGRMVFAGLGSEVARRPALARYWQGMQARPSFAAADVWTRPHLGRLIGGMLGLGR